MEQEKTALIHIHDVLLDPHNPRLRASPHTHDQQALMRRISHGYGIRSIMDTMAAGLWRAPEPLMAVESPEGMLIIDGNLRLTAARCTISSATAQEMDLPPVSASDAVAASLEQLPITIFATRDEAHETRVCRQVSAGRHWDSLTSAQDMASMLDRGVSAERIGQMYRARVADVNERVMALRAFVQADPEALTERHPKMEFRVWSRMLADSSIRQALGLNEKHGEPADGAAPIADSGMPAAQELRGWLQRGENGIRPRIADADEAAALCQMYDDETAMARFRKDLGMRPSDAQQWRRGAVSIVYARETSEALKSVAERTLADLKAQPDSPVEMPGLIHVVEAHVRLHHDGTLQNWVRVQSMAADRHLGIPNLLTRIMQDEYGMECAVEMS